VCVLFCYADIHKVYRDDKYGIPTYVKPVSIDIETRDRRALYFVREIGHFKEIIFNIRLLLYLDVLMLERR